MIKYIVLILSLISTNFGIQAQTLKDSLLEDIAFYSPTSYSLLMNHDGLESSYNYSRNGSTISTTQNTDTYEFMNWDSYEAALGKMATNIHEICHSYNHYIPYWEMNSCTVGSHSVGSHSVGSHSVGSHSVGSLAVEHHHSRLRAHTLGKATAATAHMHIDVRTLGLTCFSWRGCSQPVPCITITTTTTTNIALALVVLPSFSRPPYLECTHENRGPELAPQPPSPSPRKVGILETVHEKLHLQVVKCRLGLGSGLSTRSTGAYDKAPYEESYTLSMRSCTCGW